MKKPLTIIIALLLAALLTSCTTDGTPLADEPIQPVPITNIQTIDTIPLTWTSYLNQPVTKQYFINRNGSGTILETQNDRVRMLSSSWTFRITSQYKVVTKVNQVVTQEEFVMNGLYSFNQNATFQKVIKHRIEYRQNETLRFHVDTDGNSWNFN
jgi:hypothetical protein